MSNIELIASLRGLTIVRVDEDTEQFYTWNGSLTLLLWEIGGGSFDNTNVRTLSEQPSSLEGAKRAVDEWVEYMNEANGG